MILEELRADEPSPLALALHRRLTVIVGLGPERRAWLAAAVADAMAGRPTSLWGVAQVVGMRVDLADHLVVRSTAGVHPVMGPGLWRSDGVEGSDPKPARDDLWPTSSLPERGDVAGQPSGGPVQVLTPPPAAAPAPPAAGEASPPARRRRWRRSAADGPSANGGTSPGDGGALPGPGAFAGVPPPPDEPPQVPPPVVVPDPSRPAALDERGPPVPAPLVLPPRPEVAGDHAVAPPRPPTRPAALDAPPRPVPGDRPGPPVLPPPPPPPPSHPEIDAGLERRVALLAQELAACGEHRASARAAVEAVVVPALADPAPVAAALAELERRRHDEVAVAEEARRLAERWAEAESAAAQARTSRVPAWLMESAARGLEQARHDLAAADAEADAPLDLTLVDRLEAAHREVTRLEERRRSTAGTRRRLQAAREAEADLLRQLGLPSHASLALRLDMSRRTVGTGVRRERAAAALAEAEAMWAELHAPRDDSAAAEAAAHLAEVWAEITAFLGHGPADVLGALAAPREPSSGLLAAAAATAEALRANGTEAPATPDELVAAARSWLAAADERAAAVAAAEAAAGHAAAVLRAVQEAEQATAARHAEAVAALTAAKAAAAARRSAEQLAHQQATVRWRQQVQAAEEAASVAQDRWAAAVAEHERWLASRHDAELAYEREVATHREALTLHVRREKEARTAARNRADEEWEAEVAAVRAEHKRQQAERAGWERQRAEVAADWQARLAAAAAERRRLEEERVAAVAALAAWHERHVAAPSLPELEVMLQQRVADNQTTGPAGAVPLVVDDALSSLPPDVGASLFGQLVEISATMQVVYLTDDPATMAIARSCGVPVLDVAVVL